MYRSRVRRLVWVVNVAGESSVVVDWRGVLEMVENVGLVAMEGATLNAVDVPKSDTRSSDWIEGPNMVV